MVKQLNTNYKQRKNTITTAKKIKGKRKRKPLAQRTFPNDEVTFLVSFS